MARRPLRALSGELGESERNEENGEEPCKKLKPFVVSGFFAEKGDNAPEKPIYESAEVCQHVTAGSGAVKCENRDACEKR